MVNILATYREQLMSNPTSPRRNIFMVVDIALVNGFSPKKVKFVESIHVY